MSSCMLFFTVIIAGAYATDYCNIKLCSETETTHTMCTYTSPAPASRCLNWRNQGLSAAEKQAILNVHNAERRRVAAGKESRGNPGPQRAAVKMPDLTWDDELETIAQRWANQCIYDHDECSHVERFPVGQNVARVDSSGENDSTVEELVQIWINEVDLFDRDDVYKLPDDILPIGHYTQVVYGDTNKIGCGRMFYKTGKNERHFLVCNYGPAGNMEDEPIYKTKD
uniref:Venom allergen 3 n=1 Tax=Odontomachus monticola TaxID=613454 RepID=A0A348G5X6_ODOMO